MVLKISRVGNQGDYKENMKQSKEEADILLQLAQPRGHRSIVRCFREFAEGRTHIIALSRHGQNLHDWVLTQPRNRVPEEEGARVLHDLASALTRVHSLGFVHADLKLRNLLLKQPGANSITMDPNEAAVVLCDFGSCSRPTDVKGLAFARHYRAPEVVYFEKLQKEGTKWGPPADIFAAGCVIAELVTDADECLFTSVRNKEHINQLEYWFTKVTNQHEKGAQWPDGDFPREDMPVAVDDDFQAGAVDMGNVKRKTSVLSLKAPKLRSVLWDMTRLFPDTRPTASRVMEHDRLIQCWPKAREAGRRVAAPVVE